MEDKVELIK